MAVPHLFFLILTATIVASAAGQLVSYSQFSNAVTSVNGYGAPSRTQYDNFINRAGNGQITTKRELAMFLANIIHESAGLTAREEWGPPPPGTYVSSVDRPGKRYHGRGYIQLTWGYNYQAASLALYGDLRLLNDPDQVKTNEQIAWDVSYWFWSANVHHAAGVQSGNFGATIRAINGGRECGSWPANPTGARTRIRYYEAVLRAFGIFAGSANCPDACNCVLPVSGGGGGGGATCAATYVVQSGDSFWLIATKYGMSIAQLQALNPSIGDPTSIYPGQSICVRR